MENTETIMRLLNFAITLITFVTFSSIYGQSQKTDSINSALNEIHQTDQNIRFELLAMQKKGEMQTDDFKNLILKMKKTDSINLSKIKAILDKYGWPKNLNQQANQTIFLVIQHAELKSQEKYLPLMRKAVKEGKTLPSNLALLEDRIALRKGKNQIYVSQVFIDSKTGEKYVEPLEDPETVDKRRTKVGLSTMDEYLKQAFQMEWSIEQYYKDLPKIKKILRER